MATIKDSAGREWQLRLTVATMRQIRERTGHNLYRLYEPPEPLIGAMHVDDELVLSIAFAACHKQAEERKVDLAAFLDAFDGEPLRPACVAFLAELTDFFRRSGRPDDADLIAAAGRKIQTERNSAKERLIPSDSALSSPPSPKSNLGTTPPAS